MIYKAISNVMAEIGAITKDKKNLQQGFMYRGIDDVMNALQPLLIKNKVFIVPEVTEYTREERATKSGGNLIYSVCKIKYTFYAEDGSSFTAVVVGEGMDSGDKATNKAMAIAFKYVCFQVFCIPTEEMHDPDSESHEVNPKPAELHAVPDELICEDCGGRIQATPKRTVEQIISNTQKYYQKNLCGPCGNKRYKEAHPELDK